ncbi:MAG: hypothetical protein ACFFDH_04495 [Promethearchaeota archaeon]
MVSIRDMQILASENGLKKTGIPGKCLSPRYINDKTKLRWQCGKCGYIWETTPHSIKKGRWCARCIGNIKYTLNNMREFARRRGIEETGKPGKCLSQQYINNKVNLRWQCGKCGTIWNALPKSIIHNTWCPNCSSGKAERTTREIFEELFNEKFQTSRPNWLINPITNSKMHLDGYNRKLKLAFEYNGMQHYFYNEFFHRTYQEFLDQQKRDIYKRILCKAKGITLIVIPYTVRLEKLRDFVITEYNKITGDTLYTDSTNN